MIDPKSIKVGKTYIWTDETGEEYEITIIGKDPYNGEWVAACKEWVMGIPHIDEDDFEMMRSKD